MYRAYYGLTFDPFTKEVNTKNFYKSYQFNQGLSRLDFLKQNKGFGLITGEPGVNDNITMNRKWKIKMYKNDH